MEINKTKIEGNKKGLCSIDIAKDGKHMMFTTTSLGFLKASFKCDDPKKTMWFQERFDIEKKDVELYKLTDSIFFSYGNQVLFDAEGPSSLMLAKDNNKYSFYFCNGETLSCKQINCSFMDDTTENDSLKKFFYGLQDVNLAKTEEVTTGKSLKKSKKTIESQRKL